MNTKPPVIRVDKLHRYLGEGEGRVHVLRGIQLEIHSGQTCSIVGPSGCGKSTLLYLLGLLDRPDSGEIYLADRPLANGDDDERTHARNAAIGFVFQFHFLLAEFSALENIMLPMRKLGLMSPSTMRDRARHLLEQVGIGNKADRMANQLSGGEQQRVAIARSLANSPAVLLADEPTGNLDAANSAIVFELLQKVATEMGQAVVIVTHNLDLAHRCNRVLTMKDGQFIGETLK